MNAKTIKLVVAAVCVTLSVVGILIMFAYEMPASEEHYSMFPYGEKIDNWTIVVVLFVTTIVSILCVFRMMRTISATLENVQE